MVDATPLKPEDKQQSDKNFIKPITGQRPSPDFCSPNNKKYNQFNGLQ